MTVSSSGNAGLDNIVASYQSTDTQKAEKEDALGQEAFLTMLVAQLQNQDPLNPMEGSDFSAQLAQFSQLEQLMTLNDSMEALTTSFASDSEKDLVDYLGKQVTGEIDSMQVKQGEVSGGFFNLTTPAEVIVEITDASGKTVKTMPMGTKTSGSHLISWDGTDNNGDAVTDGTYTYTVLANNGGGYAKVPNHVTGTVDGIAYSNGKAYLVVQGLLLDPESLTSVDHIEDDMAPVDSAMSYLGKTVTSNQPIIEVDEGVVQGEDLSFTLERPEAVTINVYDPFDTLVRTITLEESETSGGENTVSWDAVNNSGFQAGDGLYYYTVTSDSGTARTPVTEEVSGLRNKNGAQYLVLQDSGRLVSLSSITAVDN
jgi:flagellar basal-body rod modification protein FlgD